MTTEFSIKNMNDKVIGVYTPYNADFVSAIKKVSGASWLRDRGCWGVPAAQIDVAREIMRRIYGRDDQPTDTVSVRIRVPQEKIEWTGGVVIWGKTLAYASGRDSGAKTGDGVSLITGDIASGGSVKNWKSIVAAESEFKISGVPAQLIDNCPDWAEIISVTRDGIDRAALEEEKARLMARIEEIDRLLADQ